VVPARDRQNVAGLVERPTPGPPKWNGSSSLLSRTGRSTPGSKLAATGWVTERTHIDGLADLDSDSCYRAMDWLLECETELAESVYWATADLLNLEVDLLFFDTTSTYFETPTADQPADGATVGVPDVGQIERPPQTISHRS
jgi:hypothetical protein